MSEIHIKIDGEEKPWSSTSITPKDILELGDKAEPYNIYRIYKNRSEEIWGGDEKDLNKNLQIQDGDEFNIIPNEQKEIHYTVNGEEQPPLGLNENKLTVSQILVRAEFVPVDKFRLFDVKTEKSYSNPNEEIIILAGDGFLALSAGPTPVAI